MRGAFVALLTGALLLPAWALAPTASAHCDTAKDVLLQESGCIIQNVMEQVVVDLNAASGGDLTFIFVKDKRFHPEVATVRSGGTVVWFWGDVQSADDHDPRNTGRCLIVGADPLADPRSCLPGHNNIGAADGPKGCWDIQDDTRGNTLGRNGNDKQQTYPITFEYDPAAGVILESHGLMSGSTVGQLTGAPALEACDPGIIFSRDATRAVVPYHCGIHGGAQTQDKTMRAILIVEA